ncbi:hypothetical protein AGR3A_Cc280060 [Agrobacterium tomkonis CFBP 6623]|uniref:Uncharacterized protein n=1 Tax=Agrobacterium tomkonis CFBP 6623 TaxID=1183432 RepID=A0A1S7PQ98_9HYPH|nr:hypothetical protein AGR3A_Cc280060 [Agrobacterium tomkonis CFBP 6623]
MFRWECRACSENRHSPRALSLYSQGPRTCVPPFRTVHHMAYLQAIRQCHEFLDRQRFCPPCGVNARLFQQCFAAKALHALPQHLAPLTEGGFSHFFKLGDIARQGLVLGQQVHDGGCHLRRWAEGLRRDVEGHFRYRAPAGENAEAAVMIVAFFSHDALADFLLEHQRHGEPERRPRLRQKPVDQQLCADIIRQVGDDTHRFTGGNHRLEIGLEGIALNHLETPGIMRFDFRQRRQATAVAFDGDDFLCAERKNGAGEAARARADLDHRHAFERPRCPGDLLGEVEVEQEVLPKGFLRIEPMALDDIAQRWQSVYGRHYTTARLRV